MVSATSIPCPTRFRRTRADRTLERADRTLEREDRTLERANRTLERANLISMSVRRSPTLSHLFASTEGSSTQEARNTYQGRAGNVCFKFSRNFHASPLSDLSGTGHH